MLIHALVRINGIKPVPSSFPFNSAGLLTEILLLLIAHCPPPPSTPSKTTVLRILQGGGWGA